MQPSLKSDLPLHRKSRRQATTAWAGGRQAGRVL